MIGPRAFCVLWLTLQVATTSLAGQNLDNEGFLTGPAGKCKRHAPGPSRITVHDRYYPVIVCGAIGILPSDIMLAFEQTGFRATYTQDGTYRASGVGGVFVSLSIEPAGGLDILLQLSDNAVLDPTDWRAKPGWDLAKALIQVTPTVIAPVQATRPEGSK